MERTSGVDLHMETSEGGLKELVLRWFTETQAPLFLNNGNFPDWFRGFATRKDAEDLLRDKDLGCFLVRLSDKTIGYILSYRGQDRCRHFVITQDPEGQFGVSGDCRTYSSLTELIQFYRENPIQPFGEHLTSSCQETELYDVVNFTSKERSGVSVQALRTLWDQKTDRHSQTGPSQQTQQESDPPTAPPALPPKSKSRKLTGAVSVDMTSLSQGGPPVPHRGLLLGFSQSGSLPDTTPHPEEERLRGRTNVDLLNTSESSYPGDLFPPGSTYSELTQVEIRSRSLPGLNMKEEEEEEEEEEEYSNQVTAPSSSWSPAPLKKVTCHTYSLHEPRGRQSSSRSEQQVHDEELTRTNPLYQDSEGPGLGPADQGLPENTYELIPGEAAAVQGNTYESLEDMKTKKSKSTWGKNNMKWKKFLLPDYKKK
ncbi:SH2 domain-containing protein 7 [Xyrichtys novacula]|uniref:SH2 domain-containing protein 7 n=1 Tax=Xyrichtys novacula TaxID=13765 RepID=A0AAV1EN10_XYRNO|nr:SH2 domain-containing protein 7 [Xyrichtys novacula]